LELYPGTPESQEALKYVRSIYVDEGNIDGFTEFIASVKGVDISTSALDSSSYQSAENQMLKGDCMKATQGFDKYLQKFPNGTFALNAKYYRAECRFINKEDESALKDFEDVIAFGPSNFYENALLKSGEIYTEQKNYNAMKRVYALLESITDLKENKELAQKSLMVANYMTKNFQDAIKYAAIVLAFEKTNEALSQYALYVSASSEMQAGNREGAMVHFRKLAQYSGNEYTAEAKYMVCEDLYEKGDYAGCEKKIMANINSLNPFPNWLAKLFILLADNYVKQDNVFQAKATLQSVIDNHDGADLVNLAKSKLNAIIESEKAKQKSSAQPGDVIDLNQN
jgi:TolA-binding protein